MSREPTDAASSVASASASPVWSVIGVPEVNMYALRSVHVSFDRFVTRPVRVTRPLAGTTAGARVSTLTLSGVRASAAAAVEAVSTVVTTVVSSAPIPTSRHASMRRRTGLVTGQG